MQRLCVVTARGSGAVGRRRCACFRPVASSKQWGGRPPSTSLEDIISFGYRNMNLTRGTEKKTFEACKIIIAGRICDRSVDVLLNLNTNGRYLTWRRGKAWTCWKLGRWGNRRVARVPFLCLRICAPVCFLSRTSWQVLWGLWKNRLKGQCRNFVSVVCLKRLLGTWTLLLVQKQLDKFME